jgi:hypothetical protein
VGRDQGAPDEGGAATQAGASALAQVGPDARGHRQACHFREGPDAQGKESRCEDEVEAGEGTEGIHDEDTTN